MKWKRILALAALFGLAVTGVGRAQQAPAPAPVATQSPVLLTLKRAIDLALQNSKDLQMARIGERVSKDAANITKAEFRPNLYIGSGAGYTYGIPATPGGQAPSIFNTTYTQNVLNEPLRGLEKEQMEEARAKRIEIEQMRQLVVARTASAYLELVKVRHSLDLLRKEKDSADKILAVTKQRQEEGFELPVEVTRSELTRAQVAQRVLQLEERQDELEVFLRSEMGLAPDQPMELTPEELPGAAEIEGANLVAMAMQNNTSLQLAQSEVTAKEFRLKGEERSYLPTVQLVMLYSVLAKFNHYEQYLQDPSQFRYNNVNAGVNVQLPIYSAKSRANKELAKANLHAAQMNLVIKRNLVNAEVRQRSRKVQAADAQKEVARLELQLAQQNLAVIQNQFTEGKSNLRDVERARLDENEKWTAFLDATFLKQDAQLELLRVAGQVDKVLE